MHWNILKYILNLILYSIPIYSQKKLCKIYTILMQIFLYKIWNLNLENIIGHILNKTNLSLETIIYCIFVFAIFKHKSKYKLSFKNANKLEFRKYEYLSIMDQQFIQNLISVNRKNIVITYFQMLIKIRPI